MIPKYNTKLFCEIWESVNDFIYDYNNNGIPKTIDVQTSATTLYYLLYAKYGNNPIANFDEEQFKYKVFSIIFSKGPTWEKRLDIQKKLRDLTAEEIQIGGKAIYNSATNPGDAPTTATLEELEFINNQNTTNYKKSKMEAYAQQWSLLNDDVTTKFVNEFKVCFKTFVDPERRFIYVEETEDE